uniref:hypothetical protein n=1 Tax=Roseovarius indicus TaxID=540747 RepID=UPI003B528F8D
MQEDCWKIVREDCALRMREDGYSVQYGAVGNPKLFIRIERPAVLQQTVFISDCNVTTGETHIAVEAFRHFSSVKGIGLRGKKVRILDIVGRPDNAEVVKAFDVQKAVFLRVFEELDLVWSDFFLSQPFPGRFDIVIEVC